MTPLIVDIDGAEGCGKKELFDILSHKCNNKNIQFRVTVREPKYNKRTDASGFDTFFTIAVSSGRQCENIRENVSLSRYREIRALQKKYKTGNESYGYMFNSSQIQELLGYIESEANRVTEIAIDEEKKAYKLRKEIRELLDSITSVETLEKMLQYAELDD